MAQLTMWKVVAHESSTSGGGITVFFAVTNDPARLPDVDEAYYKLNDRRSKRDWSVWGVQSITQVDRPAVQPDEHQLREGYYYDQTAGLVVPLSRWRG